MIKNSSLQIILVLTLSPSVALANNNAVGESNSNNKIKMPGPSQVQSTNASAGQGKASQLLGAGMNAASGAMFFGMCSKHQWWYCAMGALALAQAAETMIASRKSQKVKDLTNSDYTFPDEYNPDLDEPGDDGTGDGDPPGTEKFSPQEKLAFKSLTKQGYTKTAAGIKMPDGRTVTDKDFSSADAMAGIGVPSGSIGDALAGIAKVNAEAMKSMEGVNNEANVVSMGVDGGGGGGRSPASDNYDSNLDEYLNKLRNPFGMDANKKQQMLAGKTIIHGDDQIGVKVDDIFHMVHLRYQKKRASEEFIEPMAVPGAASGAGKASLAPLKKSR